MLKEIQPLISVIIPVYNVEKYLRKCIDSIINQTYHNLEIILVDDGSPDNCGAICDEYSEKDKRIRAIHKSNGGLSDARNLGLKLMQGEYISFVDSDDVLPKNSIETLWQLAVKENAQMVIGGFERFRNSPDEVDLFTDSEGNKTTVMTKSEAMAGFFRGGCQAWAVLYERKIHEGIWFPKGEINEDEAIVLQLYDRCETIVVTNTVVYFYRNREESITTSSFSKKKLIWADHCKNNLEFVRENYPSLTECAAVRYRGCLLWLLTEIAMINDWHNYDEDIRRLYKELKVLNTEFGNVPFEFKREKIRYFMLQHFGFRIYRMLIRIKRGKI